MANDISPLDRLKSIIAWSGLSQNQFAAKIGVNQSNLNKIINNQRAFGKHMQRIVAQTFGLSLEWLQSGKGEMMLPKSDVLTIDVSMRNVPLYSLSAVAGFSEGVDQSQYQERLMPWAGARENDFAVHVSGDSMSPTIPDGSIVLVRPYQFTDYHDLEFGRPHIIITNDDRAMLKVIKLDNDTEGNLLLISYNADYPPRSIPAADIRMVYRAIAVQAPL